LRRVNGSVERVCVNRVTLAHGEPFQPIGAIKLYRSGRGTAPAADGSGGDRTASGIHCDNSSANNSCDAHRRVAEAEEVTELVG